ncbi:MULTISPECIES: hypothetical protein [Streptomyces]|uniref:hypothetical protein n=1 Tax=Streptomyces lycopersici TaxID=2974589 RepID=UPI0021D3B134|nr:hypothetical protein [Streptomyces sp. NEAU-383]
MTTFNAVRKAGTRAGGRVAVFGIGGLGQLGGADLIVCTASSTAPVETLLTGLNAHGHSPSSASTPGP